MAPRPRFAAALALLVAGGLALAPVSQAERTTAIRPATAAVPASTGSPSPSHESQFVSRVNSLRASKGLSQLQVSGELVGVARNWTERMVAAGQISHNPNLGSQVGGNWTKLGENVGVGYDVDGLMQAFINSPAHYRNLVDPAWTHIGIGVTVAADGRLFTTHNFMALPGGAPPPPPPPPPPSSGTTAPPNTTPDTTPAPTTTLPPPPVPHPNEERVTAVLDPLRSFEQE